MLALLHDIETLRARIVPVTPALARAAAGGAAEFSAAVGAQVSPDWSRSSLKLIARSAPPTWAQPAPMRGVVIHRADSAVIGDVRFEPTGRAPGEVEIGYSIAPSRRRQGYAVEAARAVIDWLFAEAGADTLIAGCDKDNLASINTLRRLGFWLDSTPGRVFWWMLDRRLHSATRA